MKLTILGPPGSGKGVFTERLGLDFRVPIISVGDILREEVDNKTEIGLKVKNSMKKGELVSDDIILEIVEKNIEEKDDAVFDGFPRDIKQISLIDFDVVANLLCGDEICIERIMNRRICKKCNKIYNVVTSKPKKEGICDVCKGKLVSRNDKAVVKGRLKVFKRETLPIINYFKKKGNLVNIDGERSIAEVYGDIRKLFKLKK